MDDATPANAGAGTSRATLAVAPYDMTRIDMIDESGEEVPVRELDSHEKFKEALNSIDFSEFNKLLASNALKNLPSDQWDPIKKEILQAHSEMKLLYDMLSQLKRNELLDVQRIELPETLPETQAQNLCLMIAQKRKDLEHAQSIIKQGCEIVEGSQKELVGFLNTLGQLQKFWSIKRRDVRADSLSLAGGGGFTGVLIDFSMPGPPYLRPGLSHRNEDLPLTAIPSFVQLYKNRNSEVELYVRERTVDEDLSRGPSSFGVATHIVLSTGSPLPLPNLRCTLPLYPADDDNSLKAIHIRLEHAQMSYFNYTLFNMISRDVEAMKHSPCLHSSDDELKVMVADTSDFADGGATIAAVKLMRYASEFDAAPLGRHYNVWELIAHQLVLSQSRRYPTRLHKTAGAQKRASSEVGGHREERSIGGQLVNTMQHRAAVDELRRTLHDLFTTLGPAACPYTKVHWLNTCRPNAHAVNLVMKKGPTVQITIENRRMLVSVSTGPVTRLVPMTLKEFVIHITRLGKREDHTGLAAHTAHTNGHS